MNNTSKWAMSKNPEDILDMAFDAFHNCDNKSLAPVSNLSVSELVFEYYSINKNFLEFMDKKYKVEYRKCNKRTWGNTMQMFCAVHLSQLFSIDFDADADWHRLRSFMLMLDNFGISARVSFAKRNNPHDKIIDLDYLIKCLT